MEVETISRLLTRFQKSGMVSVQGKYITINQMDTLRELAGVTKPNIPVIQMG